MRAVFWLYVCHIIFLASGTTWASGSFATDVCEKKLEQAGKIPSTLPEAVRFGDVDQKYDSKVILPQIGINGENSFSEPTIWNIKSADKYFKPAFKILEPSEIGALNLYVKIPLFVYLNNFLRGLPLPTDRNFSARVLNGYRDQFLSLATKTPELPINLVLYRIEFFRKDSTRTPPSVGSTINDLGFISTTLQKKTIDYMIKYYIKNGFVTDPSELILYTILVNKPGIKSVYINSNYSKDLGNSGEIILLPNTQMNVIQDETTYGVTGIRDGVRNRVLVFNRDLIR